MNARCACLFAVVAALAANGAGSSPETWFHLIGGNVSKEGLTADLEAIKAAGISGIHFFHGEFRHDDVWPGVGEQISCLGPKWDDAVRHIGRECQRLGLDLKLQACPGWAMSGGPWIADETAMRSLVTSGNGRDYRPICEMDVPSPAGESPGEVRPVSVTTNGDERVYVFSQPVVLRSVVLPSAQCYNHGFCYEPGLRATLAAEGSGGRRVVFDRDYPVSNYSDGFGETFSFSATTAAVWRLIVSHVHPVKPRGILPDPVFSSATRLDGWEGKAGLTLRSLSHATGIAYEKPGPGTVHMTFGHVNAGRKNHPAPPEATGWECDKLDPKGAEASFAGYVARLLDGPLKGLPVKGLLLDSWECGAQTWTEKMPVYFAAMNGYGLEKWLPALFGHVVESPSATESFLRDWRRTTGELVKENFYRRVAELAHAHGLEVQYETAMGDVIAGDILSYWKYADVPMCEFWSPHDDANGFVTSYDFKPVRPCVSAAHIYGKRRVAAEAFTSFKLTWNETLFDLKRDADRHFSRGVTHCVFHTYTHNPRVGMAPPGSAFGRGIGTPFMRGQSWWRHMPHFTDYLARCAELLEEGLPVVDVLWYLGDDCAHKPSEKSPFPRGFKYDYCTCDALSTRATVDGGGSLTFPDGMKYSILWMPEGTYLRESSAALVASLEAAGATVVRGGLASLEKALSAMVPDVVYDAPEGERLDDFMWYHRRSAESGDLYFLATSSARGYEGNVRFRADGVARRISLSPFGSAFVRLSGGTATFEDPSRKSSGPVPSLSAAASRIPVPLDGLRMETEYLHAPERTYTGSFAIAKGLDTSRCALDLGKVHGIAEVYVNGGHAATLWCEPYRCDVSKFSCAGENSLRIVVTGTWRNRLVYDASLLPEVRKTWTSPMLKPGEACAPAGIEGPICVLAESSLAYSLMESNSNP